MKLFLGRVGAFFSALLLGAWTFSNAIINLIGKTTVADDFNLFIDRLPAILRWLYGTPWWVPGLLATALSGYFVWLSWPRANKPASPASPYDPALYTYDPQDETVDKRAYYDLMAFTLNYLLPACDVQIELQQEIIRQQSDNKKVVELAIDGLRQDTRPSAREFWKYYNDILHGIDSSEPTIKFGAMIDCIKGLERNSYKSFCAQADEIIKSSGLDYKTNDVLSPVWQNWRAKHNALVAEYDKIKSEVRFGKLFRPRKPSRWGGIV